MKKLVIIILCLAGIHSFAQNPTYQQKLYYTCKVWGFAKYFHSEVSTCQVNWDSVLVRYLPSVQAAVTQNDFNDVLDSILQAAGPMALDTIPFPDTIAPGLKRNRDFSWINDTIFRSDVRAILDTIRNNFRPHPICWVNDTATGSGYLDFPYDNPILNINTTASYPGEYLRILALAKYWNIVRYFNPYNYVLDDSWDSTLFNYAVPVASAPNDTSLYLVFQRLTTELNDAHVEGLTWSSQLILVNNFYLPQLIVKRIPNKYVVVKSGISTISPGDEILSIDGLTPTQWEDSLRPYISAGDSSIFRKVVSKYMLTGSLNSLITILTKDSLGNTITSYRLRTQYISSSWFDYYPNDTLANVTWKNWSCNVGYVNMGNMLYADVNPMRNALQNTAAIIFDVRNTPQGTAPAIADLLLYPAPDTFSRYMRPDLSFPGTYAWNYQTLGTLSISNPYQGLVIIIMNEETQSHGEWTCMILEAAPNAVKVGSQTAGTDGNITYLDFSQDIKSGFTALGMFYPNGDSTQRIGIVPDSLVYPTQSGIRQGRDEVLEKALEIASCGVAVPESVTGGAQFFVYPNPTTGTVTLDAAPIDAEQVTITITDVTGRLVLSRTQQNSGKHFTTEIDLRTLPSGVYILNLTAGNYSCIQKLVKE